jgi:hypothetical protein
VRATETCIRLLSACIDVLHMTCMQDVSVSSVETSSTDRRLVADSIVNIRYADERYLALPEVTEEEIARRMRCKPQLRPQVSMTTNASTVAMLTYCERCRLIVNGSP